MRRQDEIRLLYPSQVPANQKFLLSELDRFAAAFDADEVLDLLRGTMAGGPATLARQALVTTSLFLPPYVERRFGIAQEQAGVWSSYMAEPVAKAAVADERAKVEETRALRTRALARLAPLVTAFSGRMEDLPDSVRPVVWLMLSLLPDGEVHAARFLEKKPVSFDAVWAWAAGGGAVRDPARLSVMLDRIGPGEPDVLLAAMALPAEPLAHLARRLAGRVDWKGAAHLAMAIGRTGGPEALERLEELAQNPTGWGDVYVLRAVESLGSPAGLKLVKKLHARAIHEFVRRQALRAAGGFVCEEAVAFCLSALPGAEPSVAAQALESLVRLRCPGEELMVAARPLLASEDLRVRVNALLATVDPDEGKLPPEFVGLVRSEDPLARVEAAFCLGYWPTKGALEALAHFAASDSQPAVRVQAIKSLTKYSALRSLPALTRLVENSTPVEAGLAARLVARLAAQRVPGIPEFFTREIAKQTDPARKALLLTALAGISAPAPAPGAEELLASALDGDEPAVLEAALDGWKRLAAQATVDLEPRLARCMASEVPAVAANAAVVAFLRGDLKAIDALAHGVKAGAPEPRVAAHAQAALELALIATSVLTPQHGALARALERESAQPAAAIGWMPLAARAVPAPDDLTEGAPSLSERNAGSRDAELADVLKEIASRPANRSGKVADVGRRLEAATYLVAPKTRTVELERERAGARARRALRQGAALARQHPVLLVPVASFLVIALIVLTSAGAAPVRFDVPPPPALSLVIASGKATVAGRSTPLEPSDVVRVGEVVTLAGAEARFQTDAGDDLKLIGDGALTVVAAGGADGLVVALKAGTLEASFGPGQSFAIRGEKRLLQARGARIRCEIKDAAWSVDVKFGEVTGVDAEGTRVLPPGAHTLR